MRGNEWIKRERARNESGERGRKGREGEREEREKVKIKPRIKREMKTRVRNRRK